MVVSLLLFLSCQSTGTVECDDACHAESVRRLIVSEPARAPAELAAVGDPELRDNVLLDIIEMPDLDVPRADAEALCGLAAATAIRDLCNRRLTRPHLNATRPPNEAGATPRPASGGGGRQAPPPR